MKILILEDEVDLLELIGDVVKSFLPEAIVSTTTRVKEALQILKAGDFDLIIADENLPDGKGHETFSYIKSHGLPTRYVICSSELAQEIPVLAGEALFGNIQKPDLIGPLEIILEKLKKETNLNVDQGVSPYAPIRTRSLLKTQPVPCDVFLRLGEQKYVKVLSQNTVFEGEDLDRYLKKNIEVLFVLVSDRKHYLDCLANTVIATLSATHLDRSGLLLAMKDSFSIAFDSFDEMGFSVQTQGIAKSFSQAAVNVISAKPKLAEILEKVRSQREEYAGSHSLLTALVACALASCVPWRSDAIYLKLSLAAFLHDITIANTELVKIHDIQGIILSENDRKLINEHTVTAAALINRMDDIPPDIDNIILQHHERADGSGFPNGLNAQRISPLSALFIIAHDYAHECTLKGKQITIGGFLAVNELQYTLGNFKSVFRDIQNNLHEIV